MARLLTLALLAAGCSAPPPSCYVQTGRADFGQPVQTWLLARRPWWEPADRRIGAYPNVAAALDDARLLGCEVRP